MKHPIENVPISNAVRFSFLAAIVFSLWQVVAPWGWFLEVLQPERWLLMANIGRWTIVLMDIVVCIPFVLGVCFAKRKVNLFQRRHLSVLFCLLITLALVFNWLSAALTLTYAWRVVTTIEKLQSGPNAKNGETSPFLWIEAMFRLLSAIVFAVAVVLHSLSIALVLFGVEALSWFTNLLESPTVLRAMQLQLDEKKVPRSARPM